VGKLLESKLKASKFRVLNEGVVPPFPLWDREGFRTKFSDILNRAKIG